MSHIFTLWTFCFYCGVFAQLPKSAYVVNSIGENYSVINLDNQTVNNNAGTLGLFTNFIALNNQKGYVVNSGLNEIQVIDLMSNSTVKNIDVGGGTNPWAIEFISDTIAAVSLLFTNQVVFVNIITEQIVQTVSVGAGPEGMKFYNGKLFVANSGFNGAGFDPGIVSVIDVNTYSVSQVAVAVNPQSLDVDSQGRILVACTGDFAGATGQLDIIDSATNLVVNSLPLNTFITTVAVNGQDKAYLGAFGSGVLVYDLNLASFERDENNPLPGGPAIAFDADDNAYIANFSTDTVQVYSHDHQFLNAYLVGDGPVSIAVFDPTPNAINLYEPPALGSFILHQNYPNPFNPETAISYQLSDFSYVELAIYNSLGQKVRVLVKEKQAAGNYTINWDGISSWGSKVASGNYFYRLKTPRQTVVKKMQLVQ